MRDPIAPTPLPSPFARRTAAACAFAILVSLLAACGGGSEPTDEGRRAPSDPVPPPAVEEGRGSDGARPGNAGGNDGGSGGGTDGRASDDEQAERAGPRGRVVRTDGGDLRDVIVRLRQRRATLEEVRCDAKGRFAFRRMPEGPHTVAVTAPGFFLHGRRLLEPTTEPLEIVIRPGQFLGGIVSTPRGEPITRYSLEAIRVRKDGTTRTAIDMTVEADDGRFYTAGFVPGEWWVVIRAEGYSAAASRLVVGRVTPPALDVRLRPGRDVNGFVLEDETCAPIPGIRVAIRPKRLNDLPDSIGLASAVTDADGRFVVTDVPNEAVVATLLAPELIARTAVPLGYPGPRPRLLLARRGATLDGALWNRRGQPGAGRPVQLRGLVSRDVTTDDEGCFRATGLRTGTYRLRSGAWGGVFELQRGFSFRYDLIARDSPICAGVVTAAGAPYSGASVRIGDPAKGPVRWAPVGADGRFGLDGVRPGARRVTVTNRFGHVVYEREHTFASGKTVDVACALPAGRVEGLAEASLTARPLAGTTVALIPLAQAGSGRLPPRILGGTPLRVARDGIFRFDHVPAGRYALFAWRDGYAVARHDGIVVGPGETVGPMRVPIHGGGIVRGNVRVGSRPAGAVVRLLDADGRPLGRPGRAVETRDGSFVFRGVSPGPHTLVVTRHGCFEHRRRLAVTAGGNPRLRIALDQLPARASQPSTDPTNVSKTSGR